MKKLLYFTILTFMLIPITVNAEINLEAVFNDISEDDTLIVKSIPFEHYLDSEYYEYKKQFYEDDELTIRFLYADIVESSIRRNYNLPTGVIMFVDCNVDENTCDVELRLDSENKMTKTYNVEFIGDFDEKKYNMVKNSMDKIKSSYLAKDMEYINQIINFGGINGFFEEIQQGAKVLKMFPELKKELEKNTEIEYQPIPGSGAGIPVWYGMSGAVIAYYDDMAMGITNISYGTSKVVYVPDKIGNTKEDYFAETLKRIKEYVNDESYEISIDYDENDLEEYCGEGGEWCDIDGVTQILAKLVFNGVEHLVVISPTEESNIKKLKIESKDYENGVSVETESSDVPLDTSVKVEDLTIKYKGFLKAYDINLYSGIKDEYISKVKDGIIVRIPLPDEYGKKKLDIYHIKEDGKKGDKYPAVVEEIDGKKYAVFTTDHFSIYAVEEEIENPQTFDGISNSIINGVVSFIGLCGTIYFLSRSNKLKFNF